MRSSRTGEGDRRRGGERRLGDSGARSNPKDTVLQHHVPALK